MIAAFVGSNGAQSMRRATRSTKYEWQRRATRSTAGAERLETPLATRTSTSQCKRRSVHYTGPNRMSRQEFDLPTGQVKNGYHHKCYEKMERQTEAGRYHSAAVRVRAQQSGSDSLQSAPCPMPRCHQMTTADETSKTPTTRPAVRIARNSPKFFIRFRRSLLRKAENQEAKKQSRPKLDQLLQIWNLRCNRREAKAGLSNLRTLIRKTGTQDRHFVSFPVFLDPRFVVISWKKCLRPFEF
jgi:hypothetical protein